MTPAEEAVLAAHEWASKALSFIERHDGWVIHPGQDLHGYIKRAVETLGAAMPATVAAEQPGPTVAPARPWPDPEAYKALALQVFGEDGAPRDVGPAVIAWKALPDYTRVMCARGYQWTAHRYNGNLMFTQAKQDGAPGKTIEQPWYPLIMAKLPVWPIAIEAEGD